MHDTTPIIQPAIMADEWEMVISQMRRFSDFATRMQIDVMDGQLVHPQSFPYNDTVLSGREFPSFGDVTFEVHLMVTDPLHTGGEFISAGCSGIVAQIEGFAHQREHGAIDVDAVRNALAAWRELGAQQVGLSIMLDTPLDTLTPFLDSGDIDLVQVMSIARIGYQGEAFDERALMRIRTLKTRYPHVTINVDGGVNNETIGECVSAGASVCTVGSALVGATEPKAAYDILRTAAHASVQNK